jgi:hypothetical protein
VIALGHATGRPGGFIEAVPSVGALALQAESYACMLKDLEVIVRIAEAAPPEVFFALRVLLEQIGVGCFMQDRAKKFFSSPKQIGTYCNFVHLAIASGFP